ncbi:MAG: type III-B CRISPR module-associated protein Cmr5 [archaeon YNP-LCB-003-016]|jgi:CRISPR type III-B/RAMP module-associated protein Cmr5|uniref:type III-B CRISPR module-associated protein Cmr5 n=1 Tax=Candidatus Culexarchaeum yellowstonense TaxID=2928963 RepID=UPI0026ECA609|nr:type III-B CRISPR module-associated protein Cmr5 [Candidatus Culexarchaeum yellowstonense]MCR6692063.1 type III-B CRISPR module-associated protein Cmr5 [Candidatus Culexarchaeum yellowstonense]
MQKSISPEERAVNDFKLVYKLFQGILKSLDKDKEEFGKSFRARSRECPSLLYEVGVIPTISFIYAKTRDAEKQTYTAFVNFAKQTQVTLENLKKLNSTEGGYAAYLYLILLEIKRLAPKINIDPNSPLSCIEALTSSELLIIFPSLLMPYLLEIKRLAEAIFPSG